LRNGGRNDFIAGDEGIEERAGSGTRGNGQGEAEQRMRQGGSLIE